MSNKVQGLIWEITFPNPAAKMVALKLADNADDDGGSVFPATKTIAERTGYARSVVCKWLAAMEHCGLLKVVKRSKGGSKKRGEKYGNTTERAFDMSLLQQLAPPKGGQPSAVLHEASVERQAVGRDGKPKINGDGSPKMVAVPILTVKRYSEASIREEDTSPDSQVSATRTVSVRHEDTECPPAGHKPFTEPFEGSLHSPPSPQTRQRRVRGARGRDSKFRSSEWLEQLRADQTNAHVLEHLIAPLLAGLWEIDHGDPIALLRSIRDHRDIANKPPRVLKCLAERLTSTRKILCSVKDVIDEIGFAIGVERMVTITPAHPSWEAWLEHHQQAGSVFLVKFYTQQGYMPVWSERPPTHAGAAA